MTGSQSEAQGTLRITQVRSRIGNQSRIVRVLVDGLGLGKIGSHVDRPDNTYTRGMIAKVSHMVRVEQIEGQAPAKRKPAARKSAAKKTAAKKPAAKKAPAKSRPKKAAPTAPAKSESSDDATTKASTSKEEKPAAKPTKAAAKATKAAAKTTGKATSKTAGKKAAKDESGSTPAKAKAEGGKEAEE